LPKTAHNVHLHVSHEKLAVEVPVTGQKTLRFYDALGNAVGTYMFEEAFASFDVSGRNGSVFVLLEVNGTLLFAKRVKLR